MKLYRIIKTVSHALLFAILPLGVLTSCDDFLSIKPMNEIVLENYWTEEADVNSVLNSCYAKLESADCIRRMMVWGELRSDNITNGSNPPYELQEALKENILETNSYTNWLCFYDVINTCNTVIYYAPGVHDKDPNFTESELRAVIAEATTIRALCYFYLIRAFRDVPYVTDPSIDDTHPYQMPATKFDEVLDHLISDVESVKNDALRSYGEKSVENTCRITRWACYALLADMYLWKGEWQKCVDNCDLVINEKIRQYEEDYEENPTIMTQELYGKYPLISESGANSNYAGNAYTEIFGEGNSSESVFELVFQNNQTTENSAVSGLYGNRDTKTGGLGAPTFLFAEVYAGTNDYFSKTDCRYLENMFESNNKVYICKYVNEKVSFRTTTTTGGAPTVTSDARIRNFANWIIYRLTDVMLMQAEAEVQLAGDIPEGATPTEEQLAHYQKAFELVDAVWRRGNNKRVSTTDVLKFDDYSTSRMAMEDLVMDERQRELMFEGKRWFDLVRQCRRDGENSRMIQKVYPKFVENSNAVRIKLASKDILYWPYNRDELKKNPELKQNPAYETDKTEQNY